MLVKKCPELDSNRSQAERRGENGCKSEVEDRVGSEPRDQVRDRVESLERVGSNMVNMNKNRSQTKALGLESSEFPIRKDVAALKSTYDNQNTSKQQSSNVNHHHHKQQQLKQQVHDDHRHHNHHAHHSCLAANQGAKLVSHQDPPPAKHHNHQPHCIHHHHNQACHRHQHHSEATKPCKHSVRHQPISDKSYVLVEYRHGSQQINEQRQPQHRHSGDRLQEAHSGILHNNKRTTMRFISQLYFLIHLSAILSLLLHHKNLVASERKLLLYQHPNASVCTHTSSTDIALSDSNLHLMNRRMTMGAHQNGSSPVELNMRQNDPNSPVSNPLPVPSTHQAGFLTTKNDSDQAYLDHSNNRYTKEGRQLLSGSNQDNDVFVRMLGFWHAKYVLHYFLAYLLTSSVAILISWRLSKIIRRRKQLKTKSTLPLSEAAAPKQADSYGFYYRARLDCAPVLIGCISLGLIQLIVTGLDIANNFYWHSESQRGFTFLLLVQFAFVALLMQHIFSRVAKSRRKQRQNMAMSAASLLDRQRLATERHLAELDLPESSAAAVSMRAPQPANTGLSINNNGPSPISIGLQNIALAHLLVTHILLWLMKSNSINLFQSSAISPTLNCVAENQLSPTSGYTVSSRFPFSSNETSPYLVPATSNKTTPQKPISTTATTSTTLSPLNATTPRVGREYNGKEASNKDKPRPPVDQLEEANTNKTTEQVVDGSDDSADTDSETDGASPGDDTYSSSPANRFGDSPASGDDENKRTTTATPSTTSTTGPPASSQQPSPRSRPIRVVTAGESGVFGAKSNEHERPWKSLQPPPVITTNAPIDKVIPKPRDSQLPTIVVKSSAGNSQKSQTLDKKQPPPPPPPAPVNNQPHRVAVKPMPANATVFKSSIPKRATFFRQRKPSEKGIVPRAEVQVSQVIPVGQSQLTRKTQVLDRNNSATTTTMKDQVAAHRKQRADVIVAQNENQQRIPVIEVVSRDRSFPSVESDPPPPSTRHLYGSFVRPTPHSFTTAAPVLPPTTTLNFGSDRELAAGTEADETHEESDDEDLDAMLPPVPSYIEDLIDATPPSVANTSIKPNSRLPEEAFAFIEAAATDQLDNATFLPELPLPIALVMQSPTSQREKERESPTFAEYLLPIVHQYHILIIAILFHLWLDSLCANNQPARRAHSGRVVSSRELSGGGPSLLARSDSQGSSLQGLIAVPIKGRQLPRGFEAPQVSRKLRQTSGADHRHHRHRSRSMDSMHLHHLSDEVRSDSSSLSRHNSLRSSSSEQLLWIPSSRIKTSSQHSQQVSPVHPSLDSPPVVAHGQDFSSANLSVCSVFFGLLVVSTSLIVILVGINLLSIITQCLTQLLSILACLIGQCLNWRLQSKIERVRRQQRGWDQRQNYNHRVYLADGSSVSRGKALRQHVRPAGPNHRQCFHYLFLLAAYYCGISIAINLGKQHSAQQLFTPQVLQFIHRHLSHSLFRWARPRGSGAAAELITSYLSLFHLVLMLKGVLLIVQVTLQTVLIRSSSCQRATRELRQIYTFLMFANLGLWAMELCEQQQQLMPEIDATAAQEATKLRLLTLDGFNKFAASVVTLSHLYHGLVFMQH